MSDTMAEDPRAVRAFHWAVVAAATVALVVSLRGVQPSGSTLVHAALFVALIVAAENSVVLLAYSAGVSASFLLLMAALTSFGDNLSIGLYMIIGVAGGVGVELLRARRFRVVAFNCAQYALAAGAASAVLHSASLAPIVEAAAGAACFAAVNIGLVVVSVALTSSVPVGDVWAQDVRPALASYLAFGLLGAAAGQLNQAVGVAAVPLFVVPAMVARRAFSAFVELRRAHDAAISVFISAIEAKDPYTAGHAERVATYAAYIGEELGLPPARLEHLRYTALMHDIGKLAVPHELLNKPGRLTEEEYAIVRRHNDVGMRLLTQVGFMRDMAAVAADAGARYGGSASDALMLEAYIVSVADAFDAMTSTRSYRKALSQDVAFGELRDKAGTQFDPRCVEALIAAIERRGERYGAGFEAAAHDFAVEPPTTGVGSAGLGDLADRR